MFGKRYSTVLRRHILKCRSDVLSGESITGSTLNYGPGKVTSMAAPDKTVEMPRKDFRFDPMTMDFESDSGLGQYGNTVDRWGNRFYCTNRNPIMTTLLPPAVLARNPFHTVAVAHYDVAPSGGDTRVYPLVEMRSNYLSHAGTHTSACGTTAYLGDLDAPGSQLSDSVFVCEPIGHLVTRSIIKSDGVRLKSHRAQPKSDFVASTDTWFRPASLATAPDGSIYLADMYRQLVEHPKFFPPEIAAKLEWRAGDDKGRIYRIVPTGAHPRSFQPPRSLADEVALLNDANGWRQFLGQRLLIENQSHDAAPLIRRLLDAPSATTRLHAMWTLDGLGHLQSSEIRDLLVDVEPRVRIDACKLAREHLNEPALFDAVAKLVEDSDARVRFQVALTLSESDSDAATDLLARLAARDGADPAFADGLLTSVATRSGAILSRLIQTDSFLSAADANHIHFIKRLGSIVGSRGDSKELKRLLNLLRENKDSTHWWRAAAISGLGDGLPRYRGQMGRLTLATLASNPPAELSEAAKVLDGVFEEYDAIAIDRNQKIADRVAAIELLSYRSISQSKQTLARLLSGDQPVEIQEASMSALAATGPQRPPRSRSHDGHSLARRSGELRSAWSYAGSNRSS